MIKVKNKLRVSHFPQVPCKPFSTDARDEIEAYKIYSVLANQHLFLFANNIIPDYSNSIIVEMLVDGEWESYYNEDEFMEWEDIVENYLSILTE